MYGTLMSNERNHSYLKGSMFLEEGQTLEEFCMHHLGAFPVVTDEEVSPIIGELWRVEEDVLQMIDDFESGMFDRIQVPVVVKKSGVIKAWMYVTYEELKEGVLIRDGNWRDSTA